MASESYFISIQTIFSTHPEFVKKTINLPHSQCYGIFSNKNVTDMGEMLLRVGVLHLIQEYPGADDLSLEELKDILPEDYKPENNVQKPQVKFFDSVSYYLQVHRYPGLFKSASEVVTAVNAITYLGGEFIINNEKNPRAIITLFRDSLKEEETEDKTEEAAEGTEEDADEEAEDGTDGSSS